MRPLATNGESLKIPRSDLQTLKILLPYLWPKDALEMRLRVLLALVFLALAKAISAGAPILYKMAIDSISDSQAIIIIVPVGIIISYVDI